MTMDAIQSDWRQQAAGMLRAVAEGNALFVESDRGLLKVADGPDAQNRHEAMRAHVMTRRAQTPSLSKTDAEKEAMESGPFPRSYVRMIDLLRKQTSADSVLILDDFFQKVYGHEWLLAQARPNF